MHLGQASDLEAAGGFEKPRQILLRYSNLAPIHEDQKKLHVFELDILQDDNGVFAGVAKEKVFKIRTTNGQDQLVGGKVVLSTRDCHVNKLFLMAQIFGKLEKALVVVLPPKINHFRTHLNKSKLSRSRDIRYSLTLLMWAAH